MGHTIPQGGDIMEVGIGTPGRFERALGAEA